MVSPPLRAEPEIGLSVEEVGTILGVADGIAWVEGLPSVPVGEVLRSADGSRAWIFQLDETLAGCILLDQTEGLAAGLRMRRCGQRLRRRKLSGFGRLRVVALVTRDCLRETAWRRRQAIEHGCPQPGEPGRVIRRSGA